jgi:rod shape determining protein RodA
MWSRFKTLDPFLALLPLILMAVSVVVVYVLTVDTAGAATALRQLSFSCIGLVLLGVGTFLDYRAFAAWSRWLYLVGLVLLGAVEVLGLQAYGAARWIDLGPFQLQPGELMKWVLLVALATILGRRQLVTSARGLLLALVCIGVPVVLVLLQPDLGTALVLSVMSGAVLFHSRISQRAKGIVAALVMAGVGSIILSFNQVGPFTNLLKEYQKERLTSFVNPAADPAGSGYNVIQSTIAVGSGGLLGKGLGFGSQSQLNFLPVAHADFIFAGIAEAWGLLGSTLLLAVYAILIYRVLAAAQIAGDEFGMLLCVGVAAKLSFEVVVNVGMNMGIMPVTGIPLPFLSYGGTTLITNAILLGMVQSVVIRYKRLTFDR